MILESHAFAHFLFLNSTLLSEIYTLSLHDALPISPGGLPRAPRARFLATAAALSLARGRGPGPRGRCAPSQRKSGGRRDRKSTRLNSSHRCISYAVFCLKKKKNKQTYKK